MSAFTLFHLRPLWRRRGRALLSVVGIASGVALSTAILGVVGSVRAAATSLAELGPDGAIEAAAPTAAGMPAALTGELGAVPGAARAAAVSRVPVTLGGQRVLLLAASGAALDPEIESEVMAAVAGSRQLGDGILVSEPLAASAGVSAGASVSIIGADGIPRTTRVDAVLSGPRFSQAYGGRAVAAVMETAQRLAGRGDVVDSVYVWPSGDLPTSHLAEEVAASARGRAVVVSPAQRTRAADEAVAGVVTPLLAVAASTMVVGGFLVFNTMQMAALERRRQLALLTVVGADRRRLVAGALCEAAVLGVVGSAVGGALGMLAARSLVLGLPALLEDLVGTPITPAVPMSAPAVAMLGGLLVAVIAAIGPALAASRADPLPILRQRDAGQADPDARLTWIPALAAAVLAACAGALILAGASKIAALAVLTQAWFLASLALGQPTAALVGHLARRLGPSGRLAAAALLRSPRRVWATGAAVSTTTALVVSLSGLINNQFETVKQDLQVMRGGDLYLTPGGGGELPAFQQPAAWRNELSALPGIDSVDAYSFVFGQGAGRRVLLLGVEGDVDIPQVRLADEEARQELRAGRGVIATRQFLRQSGLHVGDEVDLTTPSGPKTLPIVAGITTLSASEQGTVAVAHTLLEDWYGVAGYGAFEIRLAPGTSTLAATRAIHSHIAGHPATLLVQTADEIIDDVLGVQRQVASLFNMVLVLLVLIAGVALLTTTSASVADRSRELAALRAIGSTRLQLSRIVAAEAAAVACVGTLVGTALGLLLHWANVTIIDAVLPFPVRYQPDARGILFAAAGTVVVAIIGGLLPAARSARTDILKSLAFE